MTKHVIDRNVAGESIYHSTLVAELRARKPSCGRRRVMLKRILRETGCRGVNWNLLASACGVC